MHERRQSLGDFVGHIAEVVRPYDLADRAADAEDQRDDDRRYVALAEAHQFLERAAEIIGFLHGRACTPMSHWSWHILTSYLSQTHTCAYGIRRPTHALSSSSLSCDFAISWYTSQVSSSSRCVP